jgi:hypothetical protein
MDPMSQAPSQTGIRLAVGARPRDPEEFPHDDDALGESLSRMVLRSVERGVPPPSVLVIRPEQVDIIDLRPIVRAGLSVHRFVAAAAGQTEVDAVALLAVLDLEESGRPLGRAGSAFIEWPDNRWWHGYHLLGERFRPVSDLPLVTRRALDGLPRPRGFGGWFSRARFQRLQLQLERAEPSPAHDGAPDQLVH